jgi:hypothetical protein
MLIIPYLLGRHEPQRFKPYVYEIIPIAAFFICALRTAASHNLASGRQIQNYCDVLMPVNANYQCCYVQMSPGDNNYKLVLYLLRSK